MVPMFAIDMAGAVMDTIINKYAMLTDKATIMETEFFHKNLNYWLKMLDEPQQMFKSV